VAPVIDRGQDGRKKIIPQRKAIKSYLYIKWEKNLWSSKSNAIQIQAAHRNLCDQMSRNLRGTDIYVKSETYFVCKRQQERAIEE